MTCSHETIEYVGYFVEDDSPIFICSDCREAYYADWLYDGNYRFITPIDLEDVPEDDVELFSQL